MHVLVTCKNEDDELKMKELECSQDFSHYKSMGIFPYAQGQRTQQSLVRSGRISNSSEMLWMFSLPASMKKIRSKMKARECSQHFPHYNPMGATRCHGHQGSNPIWPKILYSLFPTPMMVQIKFRYDWPTGCGDIQVLKCLHTDRQTDRHTDRQTYRRRLDWYTISSHLSLRLR